MKKIPVFLYTCLLALGLSAQPPLPDSCKLRIGTNLSGPVDWGSEWPFVNIMKYSRTWTPHNNQWVNGGQNPWDSGLLDQIPLDAQGYPLYLPVDVPGAEAPQIVRSVWANTEALPEGNYVVLYDGEGDLSVWGDATQVSETPGRLEFQLTHGNDIFTLEIHQSTLGNHLRNIRVLLPGTEQTYQTQPYAQEWLDKLEPFHTLRFMDWGRTNSSPMRHWSERTQPDDYTWTQKSGIPYEWWIDLCNRKDADAWVCVPHAASDDYIRQLASLFRDQLEPDQKIYVEWSNEVWNWIFEQAHYGHDSLDQSLAWPERLAPRIAEVMGIWTEEFAGQEQRIVRVMGGQHGWWDIGNRIYAQLQAGDQDHLIDAISPAAYMGLDGEVQQTWTSSTTGQNVLDHAADFTFDPQEYAMQGWLAHAALARNNGKKLLFYEGGQHFTPNPFGSEQPYCPALIECQTLPGMYSLYNRLFDTLRGLSEEEMLFVNFSFVSPINCQYGTWGLLQSQFFEQPPYDNAPKYRAVSEAAAQYAVCQAVSTANPKQSTQARLYPNPASDKIYLQLPDAQAVDLRLLNMNGQVIYEQHFDNQNVIQIPVYHLPAGPYVIQLRGAQFFQTVFFYKTL